MTGRRAWSLGRCKGLGRAGSLGRWPGPEEGMVPRKMARAWGEGRGPGRMARACGRAGALGG